MSSQHGMHKLVQVCDLQKSEDLISRTVVEIAVMIPQRISFK